MSAPPRHHQVGDMQPPWDRLTSLCGEGCAQNLALVAVLRPVFPLLGMRGEIGLNGFWPPRCQPAVHPCL
jgi:hypothetical protein